MKKDQLYYDEMKSPMGKICIISQHDAIIRVDFGTLEEVKEKAQGWFNRYFVGPQFIKGHKLIDQAKNELDEFFSSTRKVFNVSYNLHGTPFQQAVWHATGKNIAYGETKSYKQIGEIIDNVKAVRAIGGALNQNPCSIIIPCHRVIGSNGKMVGYGGGVDKKVSLLKFEQQ